MKVRLVSAVTFLMLLWTTNVVVLHGQEEGWVSIGPQSGTVYALAIDPHNHSVVYAGTNGGVFKSVDSGAHWTPVNGGLRTQSRIENGGPYVRSLAIDPQHTATVYAGVSSFGDELFTEPLGAGVIKSEDGGNSWHGAGLGGRVVNALAIDPVTPTTLYAGGQLDPARNLPSHVLKSTDGGASWSISLPQDFAYVSDLAIDPQAPDTTYAATSAGLFKTTDGGTSWAPLTGGLPAGNAAAVVINPTDSSVVYAATGAGVLKSVNAGSSWTPVNSGLDGAYVGDLEIDRQSPSTLYAALYVGATFAIFKTTNEGATWSPVDTGLKGSPINDLAIDPETPGIVYAATEWNGLFKTANGGDQWIQTSLSSIRVFSIAIDSTAAKAFVGADRGLTYVRSGEGGWTPPLSPAGAYSPGNPVAAMAIDPLVPTTIYMLVGFRGLIKTTDGGATWAPMSQQSDQGPFPGRIRSLAVDPQTHDTVYLGSGAAIFKSVDGGTNWTVTTEALPNSAEVTALAVDPQVMSTLYAGSRVLKSTNGGESWSPSSNGLPESDVVALVVHPNVPSIVFAGTYGSGVFRSIDGGANWSPMNDQPPNLRIRALAIDARSSTLYAGTDGAGVFTIAAPAQFPLTVTTTGHGFGTIVSIPEGIDCGSACTGQFAAGSTVMLTATPAAGVVKEWTGCDSDTGPGKASTCTVAIVAARSVSVRVVGAPQMPPGREKHLER